MKSTSATGGTFAFRNEFQGRRFIQYADQLGFHNVVAMVLSAQVILKQISLISCHARLGSSSFWIVQVYWF